MANTNYVRHYEVPFLDDLHNYFPAILYQPEAFGSVQDLLQYVRAQMRQRFDLFSAGSAQYSAERLRGPPLPVTPPRVAPAAPAPPTLLRGRPLVQPTVLAQPTALAQPNPLRMSLVEWNDLFTLPMAGAAGGAAAAAASPFLDTSAISLLTNLLNATTVSGSAWPTTTAATTLMEPVPIRPTREQIEAGSVLEVVDSEEDMCAICQDRLAAGSEARALRACDHRFHPGCIDTWFQRDVHCPVCRHDIREEGDDASEGGDSEGGGDASPV